MTDRILFWIDLFTLHFALAYYLQKYDYELYALIDTTNRPKKFFLNQKLVKFKKSWFYHDNINKNHKPDKSYLTEFEKKYDIHLWQLIMNDRIFYRFNKFHKFSNDEMLSIVEQECKLYEEILEETKPDFVMMEQPPLRHSYLFYELCKRKKIKIIMMNPSLIGYRCFLSQEPNKLDYTDLSSIEVTGKNYDELQKYRSSLNFSQQIIDYVTDFAASKVHKIKAAYDFLIRSDNSNVKTHYTYYGRSKLRVLLDSITLSIRKKYRESFMNKNLPKSIDKNEKFVYFPLQVEPDRNLLLGAPYFTNQLENIRHIAKSLPIGYKLYVKEHPGQNRTWRSISDYKEIMNIPNVCLIHPSVSSDELYRHCSLVITIVGTSGFEAAFYGKPSIVFGDVSYSILPSVFCVKQLEDLPKIIKTSLQTIPHPTDLEKFIKLLEQNSFDFDFFGYFTKQAEYFFYGANLIDVEIPIQKMKLFLDDNKKLFEKIINEHIIKIKQIKGENSLNTTLHEK